MVVNAKIVKEVQIEPLDAVRAIRKELGLSGYFFEGDGVYESVRCTVDGDYRNVSAPAYIQDQMEVVMALDILEKFLENKESLPR